MKKEKIRFAKTTAAFVSTTLIVTALFLFLPAKIFYESGENLNVDEVIHLQVDGKKESFLYGPAYSNKAELYKLRLVNAMDCDIIALGTSRVMQLRQQFFETDFCNAGGGISKINDYLPFLQNIDEDHTPKILILGFDHNFFNENWDDGTKPPYPYNKSETKSREIFRSNVIYIYKDYMEGKIDTDRIEKDMNKNIIGLNAIMNSNGFRSDGSYYYGKYIEIGGINSTEHADHNFLTTLNKIDKGINRFKYGEGISTYSLNEINSILDYCRKNNIYVIGLLPPYAFEVWESIEGHKDRYQYIFKIYTILKPIFQNYGYEFYDYSNPADAGIMDCEFMDGFHGSEKAYLRITIDLAEKSTHLSEYINISHLRQKLAVADDCFLTTED
ncbi:hypothetical protein JW868_04430 [Candidatus Woesearchaeota archaeon]|nr:hypothetical protein [Candidatus Woesearchaeota archaeon]